MYESQAVVIELTNHLRSREREDRLRCVSSGYLAGGCSCPATIPAAVVRAALAGEVERKGSAEDRFFHFAWQGQVWLAFGLASGEIRGVYCPTHRAARDAHAAGSNQAARTHAPAPLAVAI